MDQQGYMTPFRDTRYHKTHFKGVDVRTLDRQEKFNYIHAKLRNVIERRFGHLKGFHSSAGKSKHGLSYLALQWTIICGCVSMEMDPCTIRRSGWRRTLQLVPQL